VKVFDSGMPSESYWNSLFDIPAMVDWLDLQSVTDAIVEIGCGYGTFTVPIARQTTQTVHAFDMEPVMIQTASENARKNGSQNVLFYCRDVLDAGTGLPSGSMGLVLLFNILHSPERVQMLTEASRILKESGRIAIIHWRKDILTPRGPSVDSRPDLHVIVESIAGLDLRLYGDSRILKPYHWGVQLQEGDT
jgi:SAM-dependent methyltransferase